MAALEKLAIRGIRSFSPDEEQTIEFYTPMTMIVGQNGSGKTTIIECLKYACTGKLPPGSGSGQSWIHDPKLIDGPEVKASVKLRFRARDEQRMVVVRSLQLQYKGKSKNATFRQLEGVIKTVNPITKKSESLGHKCQDLNAFIPQATGISSAILESVVFCHQEESSWPLQEGATLKKKFDDIFESTRYTKALDAIDKTRKQKNEDHKNFKVTLAGLTENREAARGIREELESKTEEIQEIARRQERVAEKIASASEKKEAAMKALRDQEAVATQIHNKVILIEERERSLAEKLSSLGKELTDSDEELRNRLEAFSKDQEDERRDLNRLRQKQDVINKSIENSREQIQVLTGQRGELKARLDQQQQLLKDRNTDIINLCDKYQLPLPKTLAGGRQGGNLSANIPEVEVNRFVFDLNGKKDTLIHQLNEFRKQKSKTLEDKRGELMELESKLKANEKLKTGKQAEIKDIERKFTQVTNQLHSQAAVPASVMETLKSEIERAKAEYRATVKSGKEKELDNKIRELQNDIRKVEDDLNTATANFDSLRENARERTLYENQEKEYKIKEAELKEKVNIFNADTIHRPLLERDLAPSLDDLQGAVTQIRNTFLINLDAELQENKKKLMAAQKKLTEVSTNMRRDKKDVEDKEREVADFERNIGGPAKCRTLLDGISALTDNKTNFTEDQLDEALEWLKTRLEKLKKKIILQENVSKVSKDLLNQILESKQDGDDFYSCVCCGTQLDDNGLLRAQQKLTSMQGNSDKVESYSEACTRIAPLIEQLKKLLDAKQKINPIQRSLGEIKERMVKAQEEESALKGKVDTYESAIKDGEEKKEKYLNMLNNIEKIKLMSEELYKTQTFIEQTKRRLDRYGGGESGSLEEVEEKLKELRLAQSEKRRQLDDTRGDQAKHARRLRMQGDLVREAETQLAEKKQAMEKSLELEKEKEALKERQAQYQNDINKAVEEEIPLKQELKRIQTDFDMVKKKLDQEDTERQSARIECNQVVSNFDQLQKRVKEAEAERYGQKLEELEGQAQKLKADISGYEEQLEALQPRINHVLKNLHDKDRNRQQIEDNLAYRRMKAEKEHEEQEMANLQSQIAEFEDQDRLNNQVQTAERQWREAREEKARNEARIDTLARVQQEFKAKLMTDKYKNVDAKYREAKIKCDTTLMAAEDLAKYHKALDRALMKYHKMKIEEINKIIRELWTRTYQGNDIEEIAIVSGEDGGGRATKSYNYRVVMKKGKTMLDMRGRCSAGQRVLASIVIRLALAETFCIDCGVMTLDEPTTNLDHDNKGGLARAIARLIAERSRQQNFQLIVITHDEDFVDMVKQEMSTQTGFSMPEYYWRISRRDPHDGRPATSKIDQVEWGGI